MIIKNWVEHWDRQELLKAILSLLFLKITSISSSREKKTNSMQMTHRRSTKRNKLSLLSPKSLNTELKSFFFFDSPLHPRHISEKSNCSRRPQTNWFFFRSSLKPDKRKNIPSKHWINVHISMILPSKMLKTKRTQPYYPFFEITSTYHKEWVKKYTNTLRMILGKLNTKSPITDTTWS